MRVQVFLSHFGLTQNPFSAEDAQEDVVFQKGCLDQSFHPLWGKIYGHPEEPSVAVVLGEKGSGKTALRLQMVEELMKYNKQHPNSRVLVLEYHDFDRFLDEFGKHAADLAYWNLYDHMDAILSLGVAKVAGLIVSGGDGAEAITAGQLAGLDDQERRDLLILSLLYDQPYKTPLSGRWHLLRKRLHYPGFLAALGACKEAILGWALTVVILIAAARGWTHLDVARIWWIIPLLLILAWVLYGKRWLWSRNVAARAARSIRTQNHDPKELARFIRTFERPALEKQPLTRMNDDNARYELLDKLLHAIRKLGFAGMVVVVDRVDEPARIKGDGVKMYLFVRSLFDLKFLRHAKLGMKLLLPAELFPIMQRNLDQKEARLDKMNFTRSLHWSGHSLADLVNRRLQACSPGREKSATLRDLVDESVRDDELFQLLEKLGIPRHVFKFMDKLIGDHCQSCAEEKPTWRVTRDTFVRTQAEFLMMLDNYKNNLLMG